MNLTEREIASQPEVWTAALARDAGPGGELGAVLGEPGERVLVVGCGTSAFVAASVAALREGHGLGETDWAYASEALLGRRYDRIVALTRSGTTTEVLACLEAATGTHRVVVTAVPDSPAEALAEETVVLDLADESSVVQTRFPTTLLCLVRAALGQDVLPVVAQARDALVRPLPVDLSTLQHVVYLGTGWTVGLAHEAALKVREAAQAWSESYLALDYRHGPLAVAGPGSLVWIFGPAPAGLVEDIAATGADVVDDGALDGLTDPMAHLVLAQRLAVSLAARRGLDPDRPRHLTRSVVLDPLVDPAPNPAPNPSPNPSVDYS
jgi:glutamine---fructose-6-phosphate transaminase (isomerizing)